MILTSTFALLSSELRGNLFLLHACVKRLKLEKMSEGSSSDKSSTPSPNLELENDVKKHPLENQWTLWYYGKSHHESETDWKGNLKEVSLKRLEFIF